MHPPVENAAPGSADQISLDRLNQGELGSSTSVTDATNKPASAPASGSITGGSLVGVQPSLGGVSGSQHAGSSAQQLAERLQGLGLVDQQLSDANVLGVQPQHNMLQLAPNPMGNLTTAHQPPTSEVLTAPAELLAHRVLPQSAQFPLMQGNYSDQLLEHATSLSGELTAAGTQVLDRPHISYITPAAMPFAGNFPMQVQTISSANAGGVLQPGLQWVQAANPLHARLLVAAHPGHIPSPVNSTSTLPSSGSLQSLERLSGRGGRGSFRGRGQGRPGSGSFGRVGVPGELEVPIGALPTQDVTVEDLLRIVLMLGPHESVVEAVEQGLHCLDSSATAALLKELSKQGQVKRAFEIFDWLRQLPQGHPLGWLCDLYTYTTMIAQCGSQQQLRKALELVDEMKARNITCNVHTYSALMNVCMKANELNIALEVFKQMQEEGVHPNLVTYNILIDVHVKKGQWDEAIAVLDAIQAQAIQAEARTYNTVISACSKAGQFDRALRLYAHMKSAGVEPSTTTYTAMIGVYSRLGQLDKCLEIYREMVKHGCERNVITYSSLISACEKAGQWQVGLELYDIMRREGCRPNTVTFNSLIAACAHGGKWEKAGELFEQMPGCGCKPDAVTCASLVSTYERCGQWRAALSALELMQAAGFHPDASVYHSLLEVLWQSGIMLAQVRALQLWVTANRAGQIRIYTNTNSATQALQYSMVTPKPGVAAVTILCWLLELRNKLFKDGASQQSAYPVVVTLQRARASRTDGAPSIEAHEAIRSTLLGSSCPFQVVLQPSSTLLTANSDELLTWLQSPAFTELTQILQVASSRQWSFEMMHIEDSSTYARCRNAFTAVCRLESIHGHSLSVYNRAVQQQRPQVINLVLQYGSSFGLRDEIIYDGLAVFDRVMCSKANNLEAHSWPLCLCSCLVLCARQSSPPLGMSNQPLAPWQSYDNIEALTGFSRDACQSMEQNIIMWLNGDLAVISALRVLLLYQERLGYFSQEFRAVDRTSGDLSALVSRAASCMVWLQTRPSLMAAGLLATLRNIKGILPVWPVALQELTGLSLEAGELPATMTQVEAVLQ